MNEFNLQLLEEKLYDEFDKQQALSRKKKFINRRDWQLSRQRKQASKSRDASRREYKTNLINNY